MALHQHFLPLRNTCGIRQQCFRQQSAMCLRCHDEEKLCTASFQVPRLSASRRRRSGASALWRRVTPMRRTHRAQRTPNPSLTPLLVRAGAARTLGSIVTFLSVAFLCFGAYLLAEVIRHPLDAQPTEVIAAAVMIALAATLLCYLFEPRRSARLVHHRCTAEFHCGARAISTTPLSPLPQADMQSELPFAPTLAERTSIGD